MLKMVIKAFHASNFLLVNQTINARAQNNRKRQNQISHFFALSAQKSEKQRRSKSRLPNLTLGEWPVKLNLTHFWARQILNALPKRGSHDNLACLLYIQGKRWVPDQVDKKKSKAGLLEVFSLVKFQEVHRQLLELSSSPKQDRQDMSNYVHPRILPFRPGKKFLLRQGRVAQSRSSTEDRCQRYLYQSMVDIFTSRMTWKASTKRQNHCKTLQYLVCTQGSEGGIGKAAIWREGGFAWLAHQVDWIDW